MAQEWYYMLDGEQRGPVSAAELKHLAAAGKLRPDDKVRKGGMDRWVTASQINGLFPDLHDQVRQKAEAVGKTAKTVSKVAKATGKVADAVSDVADAGEKVRKAVTTAAGIATGGSTLAGSVGDFLRPVGPVNLAVFVSALLSGAVLYALARQQGRVRARVKLKVGSVALLCVAGGFGLWAGLGAVVGKDHKGVLASNVPSVERLQEATLPIRETDNTPSSVKPVQPQSFQPTPVVPTRLSIEFPSEGQKVSRVETLQGRMEGEGWPVVFVGGDAPWSPTKEIWWVQNPVEEVTDGVFRCVVTFGDENTRAGDRFSIAVVLAKSKALAGNFKKWSQRGNLPDELPHSKIVTVVRGGQMSPSKQNPTQGNWHEIRPPFTWKESLWAWKINGQIIHAEADRTGTWKVLLLDRWFKTYRANVAIRTRLKGEGWAAFGFGNQPHDKRHLLFLEHDAIRLARFDPAGRTANVTELNRLRLPESAKAVPWVYFVIEREQGRVRVSWSLDNLQYQPLSDVTLEENAPPDLIGFNVQEGASSGDFRIIQLETQD